MGCSSVDGFEYAVFCIWECPVIIFGWVGIDNRSDDIEALFLLQIVCNISPRILIPCNVEIKSVKMSAGGLARIPMYWLTAWDIYEPLGFLGFLMPSMIGGSRA